MDFSSVFTVSSLLAIADCIELAQNYLGSRSSGCQRHSSTGSRRRLSSRFLSQRKVLQPRACQSKLEMYRALTRIKPKASASAVVLRTFQRLTDRRIKIAIVARSISSRCPAAASSSSVISANPVVGTAAELSSGKLFNLTDFLDNFKISAKEKSVVWAQYEAKGHQFSSENFRHYFFSLAADRALTRDERNTLIMKAVRTLTASKSPSVLARLPLQIKPYALLRVLQAANETNQTLAEFDSLWKVQTSCVNSPDCSCRRSFAGRRAIAKVFYFYTIWS